MKNKSMFVAPLAVLAMLGAVAGCTSENAADGAEEKSTLDGHYQVGTVNIKGRDVTCVSMKRGVGDNSWGGLSCDFTGALDERR